MKINIKNIQSNIKHNFNKMRYEYNDAAPWLKLYDELNYVKSIDYPNSTLFQMVEKTALKFPNYKAYEYFGKKTTYSEFIKKIKDCAKSLTKIGVKKDDVVTMVMPNTPEGIICFYATNLIGAVANMVHPLSSAPEIEFCISKAKSTYLLTMDFVYEKVQAIKDKVNLKKIIITKASDSMGGLTTIGYWFKAGRKIKIDKLTDDTIMWKDMIAEGKNTNLKKIDQDTHDLAVILYSGGTTGTPKGIMLSNYNFNALALQYQVIVPQVKPGESMLCILPIFHGFGLGVCFHTVFTVGMKAIIIPKFTPAEFGKLIKTYQPNFIAGVPTLFEALLNSEFRNDGLKFVTTVVCGGDMLSPELQRRVNKFLKVHGSNTQIRVGWGMTECVAAPVAMPVNNCIPGSIGIPNPDCFVKIVKPETNENIYYDEDGEICLSGPTVMMGYLDEEEETKNTLKMHGDGKLWLHTGDMGSMDKKGIIYFKGRIKRMIISSGYNIYPNHVENIINLHPKVLTSVVVGTPHQYKGETVSAFVVLRDEYKLTDEIKEEIKKHCQDNLAKYSWPTVIEYRETLPVTKIGKIDYRNVK